MFPSLSPCTELCKYSIKSISALFLTICPFMPSLPPFPSLPFPPSLSPSLAIQHDPLGIFSLSQHFQNVNTFSNCQGLPRHLSLNPYVLAQENGREGEGRQNRKNGKMKHGTRFSLCPYRVFKYRMHIKYISSASQKTYTQDQLPS